MSKTKKKGLILGSTKGLSLEQLFTWASTAPKTGNRVVLLNMDGASNKMLSLQLRGIGVEVIDISVDSNMMPHNLRFSEQYNYLKNCDEEYCVITDVRDVLFQGDPIEWIENNIGDHSIVCASEGLLYKDEPWGRGNLMEGYPELYETHKDNLIMNVGVIGGKTKDVAEICLRIFEMCKVNKAHVSDQSSFNIICAEPSMQTKIKKVTSRDPFALHSSCLIRDCRGSSFVLNDTTAHLLKDPEPVVENGTYKTPSGIPYAIVHQWDRIPPQPKEVVPPPSVITEQNPQSVVDMMKKYIKEKNVSTVLDIGANVGQYAMGLKKDYPHMKILSLEANRECQPYLQHYLGDSYLICCPSDRKGTKKFYKTTTSSICTGNSLYRENTEYYSDEKLIVEEVETDTLDYILESNGYGDAQFDLIKMDTQGSELDILKGADRVLQTAKMVVVETDTGNYNLGCPPQKEVKDYLEAKGFVVVGSVEDHFRNGKLIQQDLLFVKNGS